MDAEWYKAFLSRRARQYNAVETERMQERIRHEGSYQDDECSDDEYLRMLQ